ncbi:MAG: hypothetical protein J6Q48_07375 [Bacteroidaceae bacterium]|nr:hypothetical protein [Bacteroidaceae bacterium]
MNEKMTVKELLNVTGEDIWIRLTVSENGVCGYCDLNISCVHAVDVCRFILDKEVTCICNKRIRDSIGVHFNGALSCEYFLRTLEIFSHYTYDVNFYLENPHEYNIDRLFSYSVSEFLTNVRKFQINA